MHHDHEHHHHDEPAATLSFNEKVQRLLQHWKSHNDDHAANYRKWADDCQAAGLEAIAARMREAARLTEDITAQFDAALKAVQHPQ